MPIPVTAKLGRGQNYSTVACGAYSAQPRLKSEL